VVGVASVVLGGEEGGEGLVSGGELEVPYMLSNNPSTFVVCSSGGGFLTSKLLPENGSE